MSLLGLLATLAKWIPSLSIQTDPLRSLAKKNVHFTWTEDLSLCMDNIRSAVKDRLCLSPFDPCSRSLVFMDASYKGLGYILAQIDDKGQYHIISCGSTTLSEQILGL